MLVISGYNYQEPQPTGLIKCTLKGVVIDRSQSSRILLKKESEDPRIHGVYIPIINGKFEYVLNFDHEELYTLVFEDELLLGAFRPVVFISEQGIINFTLHPTDQFDKNIVEGGNLNREYLDYYSELSNKHQVIGNELNAKIEQLSKDGLDVASFVGALQDSAYRKLFHWQLQYVIEHPTFVGYCILVSGTRQVLQYSNEISQEYSDVYQTIFAPKYPDHPYTAQMIDLFTGSSFKTGVPFIDFTAVDFTGKPIKFSELISGKPAVLHLWASWCGPCRKKGIELIPVYEEFRDKGFVVIGVAREKSISTAEAAVKLDKYPWKNLVELNDAEQIWVKYGIGNAGGSVFLIDENGAIVAVSPSIDEIRDFLMNK